MKKKKQSYEEGQRWEFNTNVPEFEETLVIGRVLAPPPGFDLIETNYEVYFKYSPLAKKSIPDDHDGEVVTLTEDGLDCCVTKLVETGVKLPWWWIYGRRIAKRSDEPSGRSGIMCDDLSDALPELFQMAQNNADRSRKRAESLQQHELKFKGKKPGQPSESIAESWGRIMAWYKDHAFPLVPNPGASATKIAAFQKAIGVKLPDDFKESWQLYDGGDCGFPPMCGELLSLDRILEEWNMYRSWQEAGDYATGENYIPYEISGPIKPIFWNTKRIYITDNCGDHLTLDLDPPNEGRYGQVLDHSHETGPLKVLAPSWSDYLRQIVDDLETGKYIFSEDEGGLTLL